MFAKLCQPENYLTHTHELKSLRTNTNCVIKRKQKKVICATRCSVSGACGGLWVGMVWFACVWRVSVHVYTQMNN